LHAIEDARLPTENFDGDPVCNVPVVRAKPRLAWCETIVGDQMSATAAAIVLSGSINDGVVWSGTVQGAGL